MNIDNQNDICLEITIKIFFKSIKSYIGRRFRRCSILWRKPQVFALFLSKVIHNQRVSGDLWATLYIYKDKARKKALLRLTVDVDRKNLLFQRQENK
jgi:hypothetical protein